MKSFNHIILQGTNFIARKENITELFLQKLWLGWGVLKKSKINAEKFSRGIFWTQNRNLLHCWGWYVSCGDAHTSVKVCMHSGHNKENILTFLWNPELFFQIDISKHFCSNNLPHPWPTDPKMLCRSQGLTDIQLTFWFKNAISLTFLRCLDFTWNGSLALSPCPHEMIKI